jgi:hypothetical protein
VELDQVSPVVENITESILRNPGTGGFAAD